MSKPGEQTHRPTGLRLVTDALGSVPTVALSSSADGTIPYIVCCSKKNPQYLVLDI